MIRSAASRAALVLLSLVLSAGVAELYLRLSHTLIQSPSIVRTHPKTRFALVPGARGWTYDQPIVINSLGMRDVEISAKKSPGTFRILCVGDSYTFGTGVAAEDTYPKQLERMILSRFPGRRVEVLNFGTPGFNTAQEAESLKEQGLALEPEIIVLAFTVANDAEMVSNPIPVRFGLVNRVKDLFRPLHLFQFGATYYYALSGRAAHRVPGAEEPDPRARRLAVSRWAYSDANPGWRASRAALDEIARLAERRGTRLLVMIFPILEFFDEYPYSFAHSAVAAAVDGRAQLLDLLPYLSGLRGEETWINSVDPHPNRRTHALAARALMERLLALGWL